MSSRRALSRGDDRAGRGELASGKAPSPSPSGTCHPQADIIKRAFSKLTVRQELVTNGGHHENKLLRAPKELPEEIATAEKG
jgi:hypothetical protein